MTKLTTKKIRERARELVLGNPDGMRHSDLYKVICQESPETPSATIGANVSNLQQFFPDVSKPSRGLYVPSEAANGLDQKQPPKANKKKAVAEEEFYESAAQFLEVDLDECTSAVPIGDMRGGGRWGNPDVVGVYKPSPRHVIRFNPEIVTAEIKTDPNQTVIGFGQAVSYRLFSNKTYLFVPGSVSTLDKGRLETLCHLNEIGLVYFENSKENPNYSSALRAQRFSPDMFYVNDFVENLSKYSEAKFKRLFG